MRVLFALIIGLLLSLEGFSQAFQGRIEFSIEGLSHASSFFSKTNHQIPEHLLSDDLRSATLWIKDQWIRLEIENQQGRSFSLISRQGDDYFYTVLGGDNQPIVVKHPLDEKINMEQKKNAPITTNDSRQISGQHARLYLLEDGDHQLDVWMTTDFAYQLIEKWPVLVRFPFSEWIEGHPDLPGFCMEIKGRNVKTNQYYSMTSSVIYQDLDPSFFSLPADPIDSEKYSLLMERYMLEIEGAKSDPEKLAQLLLEVQVLSSASSFSIE